MKCKNKFKSLENRRAALRKELSQFQQTIADGTDRKIDDANLEKAWEIFQNLTGYSEKEILDKVSKTQPKPLTWKQEVGRVLYILWALLKASGKAIYIIAIFGAAVVTIINFFELLPK